MMKSEKTKGERNINIFIINQSDQRSVLDIHYYGQCFAQKIRREYMLDMLDICKSFRLLHKPDGSGSHLQVC